MLDSWEAVGERKQGDRGTLGWQWLLLSGPWLSLPTGQAVGISYHGGGSGSRSPVKSIIHTDSHVSDFVAAAGPGRELYQSVSQI